MDFLEQAFNKQIALQERIFVEDRTAADLMVSQNPLDRERISQWNILAAHAELSELLEWTNWKIHKKKRVIYDEQRLAEMHTELIDILHYWINLCIIWGLTPNNIIETFNKKNEVNHERQDSGY